MKEYVKDSGWLTPKQYLMPSQSSTGQDKSTVGHAAKNTVSLFYLNSCLLAYSECSSK